MANIDITTPDADTTGVSEHNAGDVHMAWPTVPRRSRVVAVVFAFLVVLGLGGWQIAELHTQVHRLQRTATQANEQLTRAQRELSTLRNSMSAAIGCLATPQVQTTICTHFLHQ